jgi:hypothetical protein
VLDLASFIAGPATVTIPADDFAFAICGDDLRSVLRALVIGNECLKRGLAEACSTPSGGESRPCLSPTLIKRSLIENSKLAP